MRGVLYPKGYPCQQTEPADVINSGYNTPERLTAGVI